MRKTIGFMEWWMLWTQALKLCSRDTYRLIWDRRLVDADYSLSKDITVHKNRANVLQGLQNNVRRIIAEEKNNK